MRDATDIQIQEIIIHILEPRGQGLVLSDVTLPLDGNQELVEYFTRHIQGSLQEPYTKAARFRNINPEQTSGICQALLGGRMNLVDGSQGLAHALYQILQNDQRISPADLGVCFYQAENYPGVRFLAILKVDPSRVFRHVVHQVNGNQYVSFEAERKAFTDERLQKSAFLQPLEPRHPDFDMLLMDRQARGVGAGRIARFFSEKYLDAEEAFDPRKYTERLYKSLTQAQNLVRNRLTALQEEEFDARVRLAVISPRINLDTWLNELNLPDGIKEEVDRVIRQFIPDREFDLDQQYSEHHLQKVIYQGDYRLKLEVLADYFRQVVISEDYIPNDPARPPFYRVTIETETWRKTLK
jgi:hypothetical protein